MSLCCFQGATTFLCIRERSEVVWRSETLLALRTHISLTLTSFSINTQDFDVQDCYKEANANFLNFIDHVDNATNSVVVGMMSPCTCRLA